ncbi:MAG: FG-GAP repeat protein, partial [Blastocatellia bacterium]
GGWALRKQFVGRATDDHFGWSVAILDSLLAVGAPFEDNGVIKDQGAVTLFSRSGITDWSYHQTLTANDGAGYDNFGQSVAISNHRVLVGAPGRGGSTGAAYVFDPPPIQFGAWAQSAKLNASDALPGDKFGYSVAIYANTALVGAQRETITPPSRRQAAYVFVTPNASGGTWSQQARLLLGERAPTYPVSVALSYNIAVVGMSGETIAGSSPEGTAYVFTRSGEVWTLRQQIVASDGQEADGFGVSVAIDGDAIMVGAPQAGSAGQGAVYVLKNNCGAALARIANGAAASNENLKQ